MCNQLNHRLSICALPMGAFLVTALATAAPVTWLTQNRFVSASTPWTSASQSAADFGPFYASVAVGPPPPPPDLFGWAGAAQRSERLTTPDGISAALDASAGTFPPHGFSGATSECRFRFAISEPSEFTIYSDATYWPPDFASYATILTRGQSFPDDEIVAVIWNYDYPPPVPNPVRIDGILQPGEYEYRAFASAAGNADVSLRSWLLIPEPATLTLLVVCACALAKAR